MDLKKGLKKVERPGTTDIYPTLLNHLRLLAYTTNS